MGALIDAPQNDGNVSHGLTHPRDDDAGDGDFDAGPLQEFVPEIDSVPEGDDVPLDGDVVLPVQPDNDESVSENPPDFDVGGFFLDWQTCIRHSRLCKGFRGR